MQLGFWQVSGTLRTGAQQQLQAQDMLPLERPLMPAVCEAQLWRAWTQASSMRTCTKAHSAAHA